MAVMDEFKSERETIKNAPFKVKAKYFWDYYKWHTIIAVVVIFAICSLIHHYVTYKEIGFHAVIINSTIMYPDEDYVEDFAIQAEINTEEYDVNFDTSMFLHEDFYDESVMATTQKLMVYSAAGDLDVMVCDYDNAERYIYNSAFGDLRSILTEEQIAKLEPYFIYADYAVLEEMDAARESGNMAEGFEYPGTSDPTNMKLPFPVGISLRDCTEFKEHFYSANADVNLLVFMNTKHPDDCVDFIEYVCKEILK